MDMNLEKDETQLVCRVTRGTNVVGSVVVDSTVGNRACGGLRLLPDIDEAELRALARAMTLKFGFLGLPQGGAKAVVRGDPEAPQEERRRALAAFAQAIAPLLRQRLYVPATDMGTDIDDIRYMLDAGGVPIKRRELRSPRSGYYTALTIFTAAKQAVRHLGFDLSRATVAIEGFGKVGSALARLLADAQARVVAISTSRGAIFNPRGLDVGELTRLAAEGGSHVVDAYRDCERIDPAALLELPVDLLCPCARDNSVHIGNAARIRSRIISAGANNPTTLEAEPRLVERGVLSLPAFVTNCGGVLGGTMEFASVHRTRIASFIDGHFGERVVWLLNEAARQHVTPRDLAERTALRRLQRMREDALRPRPVGRLFEAGLELYRRGWIPGALVGPLSLSYFRKRLA